MSNGDLAHYMERISEVAVTLVRDTNGDKSKIDDGIWKTLVGLYEIVKEYV